MSVPLTVRTVGGPFDVILQKTGGTAMGFRTTRAASVRQVTNVAPRISTGGDSRYSSEAWEQLVMVGFETGGDKELFETDEKRYQWSDGRVALHVPGRITLASQWESLDTGHTATAPQLIDFSPAGFNPRIVAGTGTHLRCHNTSTGLFESAQPGVGTPFAGNVKHLFRNDLYLFVALGTNGSYRWTGAGINSGFTSLAVNADAFGWYQETLHRGLGSGLYIASANDGSAWSATVLQVGYPGTSITDLYEANNLLLISKPEGLFAWNGLDIVKLLDFDVTLSTPNGAYGSAWRGAVYFPWVVSTQKMAIVNGYPAAVTDISPKMTGDVGKERYGHGRPIRLFGSPRFLIGAFDDGEGVYPEVLAYTEIGWHQLYRGTSGETLGAAGFSRLMDWIVVSVNGAFIRKRVTNAYDYEYPDYATTGQFITPAMDMGFPDEPKAWRSVSQIVRDVDEDNTIAIEYRLDGGSWVAVGTIDAMPDRPNDPIELLLGGVNAQVTGKRLELRYTFIREAGDITSSPAIKLPLVVRGFPRPRAFDSISEALILDTNQDLWNDFGTVGDDAGYSMQEMLDFLENIRDTPETVIYTDEWNRRHYVEITNYGRDPRRIGDDQHESLVAAINMSELALVRQVSTGVGFSFTTASESLTLADIAAIGDGYIGMGNIGE